MICEKCNKGKIVMHAFSHGNCKECKCEIQTSHTPCDEVCEACSDEKKLCKECGDPCNQN